MLREREALLLFEYSHNWVGLSCSWARKISDTCRFSEIESELGDWLHQPRNDRISRVDESCSPLDLLMFSHFTGISRHELVHLVIEYQSTMMISRT